MRQVVYTLAFLLCSITEAWAQDSAARIELDSGTFAQDIVKSDDFNYLTDVREDLSRQALEVESKIDEIEARLGKIEGMAALRRFIAEKQGQLEDAKARKPVTAQALEENAKYRETLEQIIARTKDKVAAREDEEAALRKERSNLAALKKNRATVEQRIVSLLREAKETGTFRWVTSVSFCVLVLFVIAGFYVIAWYKESIAYTIFSGEKGMQFVTLFLIVIAIILFGIMGILEGKELSALLGGLSGYILGRTSTISRQSDTVAPAAPSQS